MKAFSAALTAMVLLFAGCIHQAYLDPDPKPSVIEKIDLTPGLYIDKTQLAQTSTTGDGCLCGSLNEWRIETGPALKGAAEKTSRRRCQITETYETGGIFSEGLYGRPSLP